MLRREREAIDTTDRVTAIYSAEFDKPSIVSINWNNIDPSEQLLLARDVQLQRKGVAGDVIPLNVDDDATNNLIASFSSAIQAGSGASLSQ